MKTCVCDYCNDTICQNQAQLRITLGGWFWIGKKGGGKDSENACLTGVLRGMVK